MPPTQPDLNVRQTLPKVFLGSSSEGLSVAKAIQTGLKEAAVCRPRRWDQGVISLSQTTIEALTKAASTYDFAILVATPDDVSESRGTRQVCPRDNVLFETGLFVGTLG